LRHSVVAFPLQLAGLEIPEIVDNCYCTCCTLMAPATAML